MDHGTLDPEQMIAVDTSAGKVALHLLSDDGTDACKTAASTREALNTGDGAEGGDV
jgi:hypothetical protein